MSTEIEIDLTLYSETVKVNLSKTEQKVYTLTEMRGDQRDDYLNWQSKKVKTDASGKPIGLSDFKGVYSYLISLCLTDDTGKRVESKAIDAWPSKAQSALFKKCQEINGLNEKDAEEIKKD